METKRIRLKSEFQKKNLCQLKIFYVFCFLMSVSIGIILHAEEKGIQSVKNVPIPTYKCYKVPNETIRIDGKLDEDCWKNTPVMEFRDLVDGSLHEITSYAKILWDDKYIYAAYEIRDPNVVAFYGDKKRGGTHIAPKDELYTGEPEIMFRDTFVKFFLDPNADGMNYIEIHINPINNVGDLLMDYPYLYKGRADGSGVRSRRIFGFSLDVESKPDWYWNCAGLKSAVQVQGTLNFSDDIDQGWTVELAIPWEALKPITKGVYSPNVGENIWRAHLGHVYKPEFDYDKRRKSKHIYSTWPVLGVHNCHVPERWGYLEFTKEMIADKGQSL